MEDMSEELFGFETKDESGKLILIKDVMDSYGTVHTLTSSFPPGGQGIVFRTTNPKIVVKFLLGKHDVNNPMEEGFVISKECSEKTFEENNKLIQRIIEKPLPKDIHIALPMAKLNDYSGYVMLLMGEMKNFSDIIDRLKAKEVGGLRRKYDLLAKLSIILSKLHSLGMVYCDISDGNVYATENIESENQNVWLIDPDNIYIPKIEKGGFAHTLKYAAPEIVNNQSLATVNSDVYAFATLAFESIFSLLPFAGKKTTDWYGEDDDSSEGWDVSTKSSKNKSNNPLLDARFSGKFPWILDPVDRSNCVDALTLEDAQLFLTEPVYSLFNQTFSIGRNAPDERPLSYLWTKHLFEAKDKVIVCSNPECNWSYIYDDNIKTCPYCKKQLPKILKIYKDEALIFSHEIDFETQKRFYLPKRLFTPFNNKTGNISFIEVIPKKSISYGLEFYLLEPNINEKISILDRKLKLEKNLSVSRITLELKNNCDYEIKFQDYEKKIQCNLIVKVEGE